jgi:acyl-CoA thioester hydrolase
MPPSHTSTFKVRNYECDAYGHLNHANYLRYMEEAAFNASAAVGYPKERYESMGHLWLARETDIEYLQPLFYGDNVEIKTWVADFRRVRSIRRYEFRHAGSDELVARASTDWVYLDRATMRPSAVPPEMVAAFAGDDPVETAAPRDSFPTAPPPPPGVFKLRRRVEWRDIDSAQHVNNAVYLNYVEDCGMQVLSAFGWSATRIRENGLGIFARRERIEYRQPSVLDDELEIATWAFDIKRISGTRYYVITRARDGELLAQVHSMLVWTDLASGKPARIPDVFLADFAPNIVQT